MLGTEETKVFAHKENPSSPRSGLRFMKIARRLNNGFCPEKKIQLNACYPYLEVSLGSKVLHI